MYIVVILSQFTCLINTCERSLPQFSSLKRYPAIIAYSPRRKPEWVQRFVAHCIYVFDRNFIFLLSIHNEILYLPEMSSHSIRKPLSGKGIFKQSNCWSLICVSHCGLVHFVLQIVTIFYQVFFTTTDKLNCTFL